METEQIIILTEMKQISSQIHPSGIPQTVTGLTVKDEFNSSSVHVYFSLFLIRFSCPNSVSYCFQLEVCQLFVTVKLEQQNTNPTNTPLPTGCLSD